MMVDLKNHFVIIGTVRGNVKRVHVFHDHQKAEEKRRRVEARYGINSENRGELADGGTEVYLRVDEGRAE